MNESLFHAYILKFFPKLQTFIEKVNGKRNGQLSYLHKDTSILRKEYSPDNKWESGSIDTKYVAADFVAVDSELPIKSRDSIASANGKIPKSGIQRVLKESDILNIRFMEAQGDAQRQIARKLSQDPVACSTGLDEKNEYNFLFGLSNGYIAVKDEDKPDALMRLNFNYFKENSFGVETKDSLTLEDIKRVISKADADGNTIIQIWIAKSAYDALRQTRGAKELVSNYNGQIYTDDTNLPTPTATKFNEAFADDNNGITFRIIDRSVYLEADGVKKSVKPWNANKVIFTCSTMIGAFVYGRLAEQTNPVNNVDYQIIDDYKLISKYSLPNPLREVTSGQQFAIPVIENVDQIYSLDISEAQLVDTAQEAKDTSDVAIVVWGQAYKKPEFVTAYNSITGKNLAATTADDKLIAAVNRLNDADEAALKAAVASHTTTIGGA